METIRPTGLFGLCVCLWVASAVAQAPPDDPPQAAAGPMPLTTDTVEYCGRLAGELERNPNAPQEVRTLTVQGRKMCDAGHVIGGLTRLRHAVMLLRNATPPR